ARVHTGAAAEQSEWGLNARAYTVGHNIVFGTGQFALGTREGQQLIAHELTHVVQQSTSQQAGQVIHRAPVLSGRQTTEHVDDRSPATSTKPWRRAQRVRSSSVQSR